jgi:hypothetical protein
MTGLKKTIAGLGKARTEAARRRLIPLLREWLAANEGDARGWYQLAGCCDFLGRERLAEPCYARVYGDWRALPAAVLQRGVRLFPDYPALKVFKALTLYSRGDFRASAKALFSACREMPAEVYGGYERAIAHYAARIK